MALSWKNITVARTNCGADIFGLAGFLRDDDLICHDGLFGRRYLTIEHIMNMMDVQVMLNPNPVGPRLEAVYVRVGGRPFPFGSGQLTSARRSRIMWLETSLRTNL